MGMNQIVGWYLALNSGFGGCQIVLIYVCGGCQIVLIRLKLGVSPVNAVIQLTGSSLETPALQLRRGGAH